jgi:autotransporter-associated beta strand protein
MQSGSVSAILAGSGIALNKTTSGTVTLSGANTYTGVTSVSAGVLNIQNATAVGTTAAGTSVTSGAALEIQGGIAVGAEALTLNGTGISSGGALRNISGNNSYAGLITLGSATRINSDSGTLTLDVASGNAITGTQNLTFGGAGNVTVNDPIATSTGTLTKDGAGTLTLAGANTYTGATSVTAGTLLVNGSTASGSPVTVNGSGTTLGGTGTIGGTVAVSNAAAGAIVNPGANSTTAGTLTTGALTLSSTNANTFHIDAFGTLATAWDKLTSAAAIALGNTASTLQVNIASGLNFTAGQTYVLLNGTSLTGTFNGINDNDIVTFSGYQFIADYTGTEFDLIAVPEPSTWFAAALALSAIGFSQRKRVRACASSAAKKHS